MILFTAAGVYRLWTQVLKPEWVNWALFPGTVVSEMAYIFGCLITGGEIKRARLLPMRNKSSGRRKSSDSECTTEAQPHLKIVGPIVSALLAFLACTGAIIIVHSLLGEPVIKQFTTADGILRLAALPKELPSSWDGFWEQVTSIIHLLRRMCDTLISLDWLKWQVPLFIYLTICLAIRLAPVGRAMRPTLIALAAAAVIIGLIGIVSSSFKDVVEKVWPLLTYIWTCLLFLLVITLVIRGVYALAGVIIGKSDE